VRFGTATIELLKDLGQFGVQNSGPCIIEKMSYDAPEPEDGMSADHDKDDLKWKEHLEQQAKKALVRGDDRRATQMSRWKADADEMRAAMKKEGEITDRIRASGDRDAMLARLKELEGNWSRMNFRIRTWNRLFPSKKQRSS
jgi:hypothetical protein